MISGCAGRRDRTIRSGVERRSLITCPAATSSGPPRRGAQDAVPVEPVRDRLYFYAAEPGTVVDVAGAQWSISAINETMMTINIFTVVAVAFLSRVVMKRPFTAWPPGSVGRASGAGRRHARHVDHDVHAAWRVRSRRLSVPRPRSASWDNPS
ncbi:hypothetical protein [Actinophytocola sp.]|uniref:hypothetical protein n=1 Tax=Actinophytocola sp. TaxID=1872138 RepID=UPI002ED57CCD